MQRCFTKIDRAKPLDSKTVLIFSVRPERTSYELVMKLMKVDCLIHQVFSVDKARLLAARQIFF